MANELPRFVTRNLERYPISINQRAYWYLSHINPSLWHLFFSRRLNGKLDTSLFNKALGSVIARHGALRTSFRAVNGKPYQFAYTRVEFNIHEIDISHLSQGQQETYIQRLAVLEESESVIDLQGYPLMKAKLIRCSEISHVFLLTLPHIISDELSVRVLWRDLCRAYNSYYSGDQNGQGNYRCLQYTDYLLWEQQLANTDLFKSAERYWETWLKQPLQIFNYPVERKVKCPREFGTGRVALDLSRQLSKEIRIQSYRKKTTTSSFLTAALSLLLYKYSGQENIVIGFPFAGRQYSPELLDIIGPLATISPLRSDLSGNPTFDELLRRTHDAILSAYKNQIYPFEYIFDKINPVREEDGSFLFRVMINKIPADFPEPGLHGVFTEPGPAGLGKMHFDLCLYIIEYSDNIRLELVYGCDVFERQAISDMAAHFQNLLGNIINNPTKYISELEIYSVEQRIKIFSGGAGAKKKPVNHSLVHRRFEQQVRFSPGSIALISDRACLSYIELDRLANNVLDRLVRINKINSELVGICCDRSIDMIVGIIAILKSGCGYVALDPKNSIQRNNRIIQDAQLSLILTQEKYAYFFFASGRQTLCLQQAQKENEGHIPLSFDYCETDKRLKLLAYVMFTSGSTGSPNGVSMPHQTLDNLLFWSQEEYPVSGGLRVLHFTPYFFDVSFQEIFSTLCFGGTLLIPTDEIKLHPEAMVRYIADNDVNRIYLPPVYLDKLAQAGLFLDIFPPSLHEVFVAGDKLQITNSVKQWFSLSNGCILCNNYGPTETHVATSYKLSLPIDSWPHMPAIGKPIFNANIYLLDKDKNPVPLDTIGEIYISGNCLSSGYYNNPGLTAEKFLPDINEPNSVMYRSGDQAYVSREGNIHFIGRVDRQIKVRGFRVEPAEIEICLSAHEFVAQCVISLVDSKLVAYVTCRADKPANEKTLSDELKIYLKRFFPEYMVPSDIVFIENLPFTATGKIDYQALPRPKYQISEAFVPPSGKLESRVVKIWEDLLDKRPIGGFDNFFNLGGDSISGIEAILIIEKLFGLKLSLASLIRHATVFDFCEYLQELIDRKQQSANIDDARVSPLLIEINKHGENTPFFLVPGGKGGKFEVFVYAQLSPYISKNRPFYQLLAKGLDGLSEPCRTIEEIAAEFLSAIRTVQAEGPYLIGGECLGGVIAFEMQRQLLKEDGDCRVSVFMLDTWCPARHFGDPRSIKEQGHNIIRESIEDDGGNSTKPFNEMTAEEKSQYASYLYRRSVVEYEPEQSKKRLALIVCDESYELDPFMGWQFYAPIKLIRVPGDHLTYIRNFHQLVGEQLAACIDSAEKLSG